MTDLTNILKTELGVKSDKTHHHHHPHHHHEKIIVPNTETTTEVTHELQSQLGQGKKVDENIQEEKNHSETK